jgi:hypothetical protein
MDSEQRDSDESFFKSEPPRMRPTVGCILGVLDQKVVGEGGHP